jgi:hypothetical protein
LLGIFAMLIARKSQNGKNRKEQRAPKLTRFSQERSKSSPFTYKKSAEIGKKHGHSSQARRSFYVL